MAPGPRHAPFRFAEFELRPDAFELLRNSERIRLQVQPFRVLELLLEQAGEVVTRDALRARVWPSNVYVDFNHGLNNAIAKLREVLGDSAESPRYIETLHRVGYRFIHPVDTCESSELGQEEQGVQIPFSKGKEPGWSGAKDVLATPSTAIQSGSRPRWRTASTALVMCTLFSVLTGIYIVRNNANNAVEGPMPSGDIGDAIETESDRVATAQVSAARSTNAAAHESYLRGRHLWNQRNRQSVTKSLEYFRNAIEADPQFAAAYASLAIAYATLGGNTLVKSIPAEDIRHAAIVAARRAIELDPDLADAHWAMAGVLSLLFPKSEQTDLEIEQEYRLALALDPTSADARHGYGNFLSNRRRGTEAIAQYREAVLLDPLSSNFIGRLGLELVANHQTDEGMELMQRAVELEPWQFNANLRLAWAYAAYGRYSEAERAFAIAELVSPGSPHVLAGRSFIAARSGDVATASALVERLLVQAEAKDVPALLAIVYVGLQDKEGALKWFARARASSNSLFGPMAGLLGLDNPIYDWLRDDPVFDRLARSVRDPNSNADT